ncbi:MAG TPA: hypothetical protein PLO61_00795 [Fimbriimonadaceae bacterium]|nr:hypothetical protein [Fimbriimonadaceae bacterium]HRJ32436.1 hypothetical protein [Fimbriimonadaceae bacterium]
MASPGLHYLTLQDLIWINTQVTKKPQDFDYARLEEATFYQYGYGTSLKLIEQAGRLAAHFSRKRPLASGNEATGFVALLGFLALNQVHLRLSDAEAAAWYLGLADQPEVAATELAARAQTDEAEHHGEPPTAEILTAILGQFPRTIEALLQQDHVARLA